MLLSGWVVLTAVERVAEEAPWARAVLGGLMWAALVAGVWWFAEWTQSPLRTARESAAARRRAENTPHDEPAGTDTELVAHQGEPSAPSHS